eukprot:TRINITY_DN13894_c0_g1_i1.p1 TRINITY_DN13894_c0_g1~~TRINITY_DN13894_c0_g1_i1.p1  ORF type:complete len:356 (-),score=92.24 TRINITY_DN13894_c0_g1_i1:1184-2251(-)
MSTPQPALKRRCCRDFRQVYDRQNVVGEGTYGVVFKAADREKKCTVAVKEVKLEKHKHGFPIQTIREIKLLRILDHKNIMNLKEVVTSRDDAEAKHSVFLIFEYMHHDLSGLINKVGKSWKMEHIKNIMKQLLEGLAYMHKNNIMHRDIKGANILINSAGVLKIADWGLARTRGTKGTMFTQGNDVVSRFYRAPELLLNSREYGAAIDIWAAGVLFGELLTGGHILPGANDQDQLDKIFGLCGTPDVTCSKVYGELARSSWKDIKDDVLKIEKLPRFNTTFMVTQSGDAITEECRNLLTRMLNLNPNLRITAEDACTHRFFYSEPEPCEPNQLPGLDLPGTHELDVRRERQQRRR